MNGSNILKYYLDALYAEYLDTIIYYLNYLLMCKVNNKIAEYYIYSNELLRFVCYCKLLLFYNAFNHLFQVKMNMLKMCKPQNRNN